MLSIALIAPTPFESSELRNKITPPPEERQGFLSKGYLFEKSIVFSHCGIGKVNAAHIATRLLETGGIDIMILFGVAGGYLSTAIGDVAVAESENYGDEGVKTPKGWESLKFIGFSLLKNTKEYFNTFPMDQKLSGLAIEVSTEIGLRCSFGHFITVSQCSGTYDDGVIMQERFNGICENMEGAAVAHICAIYGIPMVEIRGISNLVEDRDLEKWNIPLAVSNCSRVVCELIRRLK